MESIGRRIRYARKAQGWTLRRLADETGYTEVTISQIELGTYIPTDRLLRAIEVSLKTTFRK